MIYVDEWSWSRRSRDNSLPARTRQNHALRYGYLNFADGIVFFRVPPPPDHNRHHRCVRVIHTSERFERSHNRTAPFFLLFGAPPTTSEKRDHCSCVDLFSCPLSVGQNEAVRRRWWRRLRRVQPGINFSEISLSQRAHLSGNRVRSSVRGREKQSFCLSLVRTPTTGETMRRRGGGQGKTWRRNETKRAKNRSNPVAVPGRMTSPRECRIGSRSKR